MTESDIQLLRDLAGGFNYNRVGILPAPRFTASVSWAKADALNALLERLEGPVAPPNPPNEPPSGLPSTLLDPYQPHENRVLTLYPDRIMAIPVGVSNGGQVILTFAEYGSPPAQYLANISLMAGDPTPATGGTSVHLIAQLSPVMYYVNAWVAPGFPPTQVRLSLSLPE